MKTVKPIAIAFFLVYALSSCMTTMTFLNSTIVPAATGTVKARKDKNNNYIVSVFVENMAEAKQLTPPKENYVVWMEDGRNAVKKLGQINPSTALFSKALKASLNATSVTQPTRVFITAEDGVDRPNPEGQIILTTK